MKKIGFVAALALLAVASPVPGQVSVTKENLIYTLGTNGALDPSFVEDLSYLYAEEFWLRMADDNQEYAAVLSSAFAPSTNVLTAVYTNEFVSLTSTWTLTGGPPGSYTSLVTQAISISNLSLNATSGVFYALFDFDVSTTTTSETGLSFANSNGVQIAAPDSPYLRLLFTNSVPADEWEFDAPTNIRGTLNDSSPTTLPNAITGDYTNGGEFGFAYGWRFNDLAAGGVFTFTMTWETTIPEPASWATLLGAFAVFTLLRRHTTARH